MTQGDRADGRGGGLGLEESQPHMIARQSPLMEGVRRQRVSASDDDGQGLSEASLRQKVIFASAGNVLEW